MPRDFYPDLYREDEKPSFELCLNEITMFDGVGVCMRPKDHKVDEANTFPDGEYHQEEYEGWIWDNSGRVG